MKDDLWEKIGVEPPRERTKEEEELERTAMTFVKSSEDRRTVFIEAGGEKLQLERTPTLELAKAQRADAVWAVSKILEAGKAMVAPEKGGATDV